ncbi:radical SAM family heme chaperone HemW [Bacillota bacterium]
MNGLGLYIHIPFCIKKCNYCDFLSFSGMGKEEHSSYIDALCKEIRYYGNKEILLDTVYIGGGTPSYIDSGLISKTLTEVSNSFTLAKDAEITIEANPGSLSGEKLKAYLEGGVNRLSLGAQSLSKDLLKLMGRAHGKDSFIRNFELARERGFKNISVDLIFSVPGQSPEKWRESLEKTLELGPEHISFYALQIEEGTPFFKGVKEGTLKAAEDTTDRRMYHDALKMLKDSGYIHYEISNAAKPGHLSRHNLKYWSMDNYLGVGLGSHSYVDGRRFSNETRLNEYVNIAGKGGCKGENGLRREEMNGSSPWTVFCRENTMQEEMAEYMFTGMRKVEGINMRDFTEKFGISPLEFYKNQAAVHISGGLLELGEDAEYLRLTGKGRDLFNRVLVDFI